MTNKERAWEIVNKFSVEPTTYPSDIPEKRLADSYIKNSRERIAKELETALDAVRVEIIKECADVALNFAGDTDYVSGKILALLPSKPEKNG